MALNPVARFQHICHLTGKHGHIGCPTGNPSILPHSGNYPMAPVAKAPWALACPDPPFRCPDYVRHQPLLLHHLQTYTHLGSPQIAPSPVVTSPLAPVAIALWVL